jgi:tetratricopeptide (TPR) repeat protein
VDTSVLEERVKKLLQDKTHLDQLNQARLREKELLKKIAALEEENQKSGNPDQKQASLKKEFQDASQGLTAVDWFDQALALWDGEKLTDPKKAIEYSNNAIKLQPYANAYITRGIAYCHLGQYQRAIEDFNEAIRLKPDLDTAYNNRGVAYINLGQYQRAIEDFNEAIHLKPDNVEAYNGRGAAYVNLDQYQRAIEDYNQAIHLKPDYANAYGSRGLTYLLQSNNNLGCRDAQKACALGKCKALEFAKSKGNCR